jgi:hypothetical protein
MPLDLSFQQQVELALLDKGLLAAVAVGFGYWINQRLEKSKNDRRLAEAEADAELRNAKNAHIQFDLSCKFYKAAQGPYIAEFCLSVENKHLVPLSIALMELDVRGISHQGALTKWKGEGTKLAFSDLDGVVAFPERVLKTRLVPVPDKVGCYSIDAGVAQTFTHIALIGGDIEFVRVAAVLARDEQGEDWHSAQRVFKVSDSCS